jgi:hypothetical protein
LHPSLGGVRHIALRSAEVPGNTNRRRYAIVLLGLMSLAFVIRLHDLGAKDLWYDEQVTLVDSQGVRQPDETTVSGPFSSTTLRLPDPGVLAVARRSATHDQPVYVSLIHLWTRVFGVSERSLRFPSVLFGVASVGLLAVAGRKLIGESGSLLAALLLTVSPLHVHYSQEARTYSLAVFATLLSLVLLLRLSETASLAAWACYGAVAALMPLVHLLAGIAFLPHLLLLWPLRHRRRELTLAVSSGLVIILLSLPLGWLDSVQTAHRESGLGFAAQQPPSALPFAQPVTLPAILSGLGSGITRVLGIEYFPYGWRARYLLPLSLPLLWLALSSCWVRPRPQFQLLLVLAGASLPFAAAAALSLHYGHVATLNGRYSIWAVPFWLLLLSYGSMQLRTPYPRDLAIALIVLLPLSFTLENKVSSGERFSVRADEVQSFLSCAPTAHVLQVPSPWAAAVVTAFGTREVFLNLGAKARLTEDRPSFDVSSSGICSRADSRVCGSAIPPCEGAR